MKMNMYFEVTDKESVKMIDDALAPILKFDEKLYELQEKYKSDENKRFNSLDHGLNFSNLWFHDYPVHLDTEKDFKVSIEKFKKGYEVRPRKSNKKFYADFMDGMIGANYNEFKNVLFGGVIKSRFSIDYIKVGENYYISCSEMILIQHNELTASQYKNSIK